MTTSKSIPTFGHNGFPKTNGELDYPFEARSVWTDRSYVASHKLALEGNGRSGFVGRAATWYSGARYGYAWEALEPCGYRNCARVPRRVDLIFNNMQTLRLFIISMIIKVMDFAASVPPSLSPELLMPEEECDLNRNPGHSCPQRTISCRQSRIS
jgi:hypothetical protein